VKPEQAIELGCEECRWYRPMVIACGYIFRDQIIQRADGVLIRLRICELRLRYRVRYYWRKTCNAFGYCPCGSLVNFTSKGRAVCPQCGG
jgi:hypothetical protein